MITVSKQSSHTTYTTGHTPHPNPHAPIPILQFIHHQPEHIIRLPHHIGLHQFGPGPASLGNYPFYLCPHPDIQQHLVNAPALTEPGQRQRLAVASILSMEPDIIVLDEPTTGQDRGHLNKFLARTKMLNVAGKTISLISHDMGVVAKYASRTIVKKGGRDIPVLLTVGELERSLG